ncbi:MAG: sulfatase [Bacteroidetes bacterium]|nr:sulfatase [Bacteroidota bacterium]MDA1121581.1 sulfatase [Bacteroidota bacterium]
MKKYHKLVFTSVPILISLYLLSCVDFNKRNDQPNILIAIMDDATYAHMGAYGCKWVNTPAFDRVARDGILFSNAYTPNAKCAPSRASILTGRNSWQLEEAANHWCYFPKKFKTYAEVLSENGYHVGHTAKGWAPGVPGEIDGKKRELVGVAYNEKKLTPATTGISNNDYSGNFLDFLNARVDKRPFCFWYGSTEPHRQYEFGSGISKGNKNLRDINDVYAFWPDNDSVRTDLLDYAYEIEYFDKHLNKMLRTLEERGELNNTLIIVTSDNGMPFPRIKGQEYELSNHLPLAIMWQDGIKKTGRVIEDFISFIDFAPTILELAGISQVESGMEAMEGKTLTSLFYSTETGIIDPVRDHVLIGKERHDIGRPNDEGYPIRGIVKGDYLYLQNFEPTRWPAGDPITGYLNCDGSPTKTVCLNSKDQEETYPYWEWSFGKRQNEEIYNIKRDPLCMSNLVESPEYQEPLIQLRKQLLDELKQQSDPRMFGNGSIFDSYEYADPTGVNFYERFTKGETLNAGWVNPTDFKKM